METVFAFINVLAPFHAPASLHFKDKRQQVISSKRGDFQFIPPQEQNLKSAPQHKLLFLSPHDSSPLIRVRHHKRFALNYVCVIKIAVSVFVCVRVVLLTSKVFPCGFPGSPLSRQACRTPGPGSPACVEKHVIRWNGGERKNVEVEEQGETFIMYVVSTIFRTDPTYVW